MDIGASTGGFTDCLLQRGAAYVYAVDVGHGQLDPKLAADERVANLEGMNIRNVSAEEFDKPISFICTDVSFISLTKVIQKIYELLESGGKAAMLIKPQFECGRSDIGIFPHKGWGREHRVPYPCRKGRTERCYRLRKGRVGST